jgi:hypothetical protein
MQGVGSEGERTVAAGGGVLLVAQARIVLAHENGQQTSMARLDVSEADLRQELHRSGAFAAPSRAAVLRDLIM